MNWPATIVFVLLFAFITVLGFGAGRWRRGDLSLLHEWGLGGRRFGTIVTWFLLGGLHLFGVTLPGYAALYAVIANLAVSALLSALLNVVASDRHCDVTTSEEYA